MLRGRLKEHSLFTWCTLLGSFFFSSAVACSNFTCYCYFNSNSILFNGNMRIFNWSHYRRKMHMQFSQCHHTFTLFNWIESNLGVEFNQWLVQALYTVYVWTQLRTRKTIQLIQQNAKASDRGQHLIANEIKHWKHWAVFEINRAVCRRHTNIHTRTQLVRDDARNKEHWTACSKL